MHISNPKRASQDATTTAKWYPYYAGFSGSFASGILETGKAEDDYIILDPWNGSGTTTAVAAQQGLACIGIDINPAMAVVAKARCVPKTEYPSLRPLSIAILDSVPSCVCDQADPLLVWFDERTTNSLRGIEKAVRKLLVGERTCGKLIVDVSTLSHLASFFYLALFRAARRLLKHLFSSNPNWLRRPRSLYGRASFSKEEVLAVFREELEAILPREPFGVRCISSAPVSIEVGDSERLKLADASVDLVLGSPPYCTRIDYAVSTAAELAVLGFGSEVKEIRRKMMGTSTVPRELPKQQDVWGTTCNAFLRKVLEHPSKASASYYYKNHLQYFASLSRSLTEIGRVLKPGGASCLVVQDSYYKNVHNDLAQVVTEMGNCHLLGLTKRVDFPVTRTLAGVHPGVRGYRESYGAVESVLLLSRT